MIIWTGAANRKPRALVLGALFTVCSLSVPHQAFAQAEGAGKEKFWICRASGYGSNQVTVGPFAAYFQNNSEYYQAKDEIKEFAKNIIGNTNYLECNVFDSREDALQSNDYKYRNFSAEARYFPDYIPPSVNPGSQVLTLALDFEPGDGSGFLHARRGYKSASINLNYRFLLCANEIQIAYSLDRKSLKHDQYYVDKFNGLNPNMITPTSEPPVPDSVPLDIKVYVKSMSTREVAGVRDAIAGQALGMGCFTGQTKTIGLVAKLIGPKATRPEIKAYIDTLRADVINPGKSVGFALLNPDVPVPPTPAPRAPVRRKAR
jgi:hypothetical protein